MKRCTDRCAGPYEDAGQALGRSNWRQLERYPALRSRRFSAPERGAVHQRWQGGPSHKHSRGMYRTWRIIVLPVEVLLVFHSLVDDAFLQTVGGEMVLL